jgi:hypothetical protein
MNFFLNGFADELVKIGAVLGGSSGAAAAPTHRAPSVVKQPGQFSVNKMKVNFGQAKPKQTRYREPSAGPNMAPVTTAPPPVNKKIRRGGKKSDGAVLKPSRYLPGERHDDMLKREGRRRAESATWKRDKDRIVPRPTAPRLGAPEPKAKMRNAIKPGSLAEFGTLGAGKM